MRQPFNFPAPASVLAGSVTRLVCAAAISACFIVVPVGGQPPAAEDLRAFAIAGGTLSLEAPAGWKRVPPKSGIVETEFTIPSAGEGMQAGRMTVMGAGGGVQANVDRWYGQFTQPDGSATKDKASMKTLKLAGSTVTLVDVAGTYKDMPGGPFAGGKVIERPDYRMLAAIIETPDAGSHFIKFYGPAATVAKDAEGFRKMIEGMVPAAK